MYKLILPILLLVVSACSSSNTQTPISYYSIVDPSSLRITLDRDMCYGTCPSYVVEIAGDGSINYCGDDFVEQVGIRKRKISKSEVNAVFAKVVEANFFDLPNEYTAQVTDNPTYIVKVSYDDKSKTIVDYVGQSVGMPAIITELEELIDHAAKTREWVGSNGKYEYTPDAPRCDNRLAVRIPKLND